MLAYFFFTGVFRENIQNKHLKAFRSVAGSKDKSIILNLQAHKANAPDVRQPVRTYACFSVCVCVYPVTQCREGGKENTRADRTFRMLFSKMSSTFRSPCWTEMSSTQGCEEAKQKNTAQV